PAGGAGGLSGGGARPGRRRGGDAGRSRAVRLGRIDLGRTDLATPASVPTSQPNAPRVPPAAPPTSGFDVTLIPSRRRGDPVLKRPARDVEQFDDALALLVDDMFDTMYDAPGVGLAAPQVGLSIRLFVYDSGEDGERGAVANPTLTEQDGEEETDEGCLSVRC